MNMRKRSDQHNMSSDWIEDEGERRELESEEVGRVDGQQDRVEEEEQSYESDDDEKCGRALVTDAAAHHEKRWGVQERKGLNGQHEVARVPAEDLLVSVCRRTRMVPARAPHRATAKR